MNKILTKVATLALGAAMAVGVGVAVGSKKVSEAKAEASYVFTGDTLTFSKQGLTNGVQYLDPFTNNQFSVQFAGGANDGKYYTTGTGMRVYGGGSFTVKGISGNITALTLAWDGTNKPTSADVVNVGTLDSDFTGWSGNAESVTFSRPSGSGHWRLKSIQATVAASEVAKLTLSKTAITFLSTDSAQSVTATPVNFDVTPTLSLASTPSYVDVNINGLTLSVSPKAVGSETVTINASGSSKQASATLAIVVNDPHGRVEDDPFTVAEVMSAMDDGLSSSETVYVTGVISEVTKYESNQITYWIGADKASKTFEVYKGKNVGDTNFTSINDLEVGGVVVVRGTTSIYQSTTYELNAGNYLVSYVAPVTTKHTISFNPGEGSGTMESVSISEGLDYTLPACTFEAPEGKLFDYWEVNGQKATVIEDIDDDYEVIAIWKDAPSGTTDTLNNANTINKESTNYESWTTATMPSGAVYAGQSAGDKKSIQLRSNKNNSGVVSTTSGGDLVAVTINFNTETTATRTVSVYGKTSAYSNPTELYSDSTKGTLLGDINIDDGASQTITVEGSYQYVGIRSKSGASYIASIDIVWDSSVTPPDPKVLESITVSGAKTEFVVNEDFVTTGLVVTGHYDDQSSSPITSGYEVDSSAVDKTTAGTYKVTVSYGGFEDDYNVTYSNPEPVVTSTYKKVKTTLADFSGDYLIVYEAESLAFDGSRSTLDAESNTQSISISNETIEASSAFEFKISSRSQNDGYSIKSSSGLYIGQTSDANGLKTSESDVYSNGITYVSSSDPEVADTMDVISGGAYLRYNSASNQNRFRYYKSSSYTGQKEIALYIQIENDAEEFALDFLNLTSQVCSNGSESHIKDDFAEKWESLETKYSSVVNKDLLVNGEAEANGTFLAEALARYDILVAKYGLNGFMTGRVSSYSYIPNYQFNAESSSSITIIVVVAVASMTLLGVTLVLRKRKHQ